MRGVVLILFLGIIAAVYNYRYSAHNFLQAKKALLMK